MVRPVILFFSHHFILLINVKILVSFTGKNNFVVCDASLQWLTKRSDRFETTNCADYKFPEKLILQNIFLSLIH